MYKLDHRLKRRANERKLMNLTITQQKALTKALRKASKESKDGSVDINDVQRIRNKASSKAPLDDVLKLLKDLDIAVVGELPKTKRKKKAVQIPPIPSEVARNSILNAGIFKTVARPDKSRPADDDLVVTTYGQLRREREQLRKWVEHLEARIKYFEDGQ